MEKIRIFIVDDHQLVIDGIKTMLAGVADFFLCGESNDAIDALMKIESVKPDIVLTDVSMPEMTGIEFSKRLKKQYPHIKILVLSMFDNGQLIKQLANTGINGYILKNKGKDELIAALKSIAGGTNYFTEEIKAHIRNNQITHEAVALTSREIEIIGLTAKGLSSAQIATKLFISENTVETHRRNIYRKTNAHSAIELLNYVKAHHLM